MRKNLLTVGLSVACVVFMTSCATTRQVNTLQQKAADLTYNHTEVARSPVMPNSTFSVSNGFYAAQSPLATPAPNFRVRLPEVFAKDASLQRFSVTLSDVAAHVSRVSGYRVELGSELTGGQVSDIPEVSYKGNLEGLLDYLSGSLGVSWRWDGQKIEIFRYETKMFRISALAGKTSVTAKLDTTSKSQGQGSGNSASSGQKTEISSDFDIWNDISNTLKGSLSSGGTMSIAPSTGVITVKDNPSALRLVEAQIKEFNRLYSREVLINVEVYAVERGADDSAGFDWTLAWKQAAGRYGINLSTAGVDQGSSASTISSSVATGPFAGSGVIAQALSTIGRTTILTSGSVSTLNGQAAPLNIAREIAYLQSQATSLTSGTAGGAATTTLTPGVVTDGFAMNVTPLILDDNRVKLRFAIDLSSIDGIETFQTPDGLSAIQLPRRSVRNFLQNVSLKNGQTLVLTGIQQAQSQSDQSGPFSPKAWFFGGSTKSSAKTRTIVIVATPYVTN